MALYFVGVGTSTEAVTREALEVLRRVQKVYVDAYTSLVDGLTLDFLRKVTDAELVYASRAMLEGEAVRSIIKEARARDVALVVGGDPFIATTHVAIRLEAMKMGVEVRVVHGVSAYTAAISAAGLQIYKFGKPVTMVRPTDGIYPYTTYYVVASNASMGLHTFVFLDLKPEEGYSMTVKEAVSLLLKLEEMLLEEGEIREPVLRRCVGVGVAAAGTKRATIKARCLPELAGEEFPPPPHSLIVVSKPHELELEALRLIGGLRRWPC